MRKNENSTMIMNNSIEKIPNDFLKERTEKNDQFQKWSKRKKKQMRNCWSNKETLSCVFEDQHTSNLSILKITKVNTKKKKLKKMDLIVANNHDELSNFRNSGRQISTLQQKFQDRLASSKFRKLNEVGTNFIC